MLGTEPFEPLARKVLESLGLADASLAVIAHPLGGISQEDVIARAESVVDVVAGYLTRAE